MHKDAFEDVYEVRARGTEHGRSRVLIADSRNRAQLRPLSRAASHAELETSAALSVVLHSTGGVPSAATVGGGGHHCAVARHHHLRLCE